MKPVSNKTEKEIVLGGETIPSASQHSVRVALITEDEKQAIIDNGNVIRFGGNVVTVSVAEKVEEGKDEKKDSTQADDVETGLGNLDDKDAEKGSSEADRTSVDVKHVVYPKSVITEKGNLSGANANKEQVKLLQESYLDTILTDAEFTEMYPNADVEQYRVEEV